MAREGLIALLENFWILREQDPETYQIIRDRESALKDYFLDKLGYHLIVHRHFAKLEKIPASPEAWMGIELFQQPRDYALLCCVLAYLEGITGYEQFLLSDLCAEVQALYPGELALDWRSYEHRKSLVRVLQLMIELRILTVVDGETSTFGQNETSEVLYEVSVVARYFMRSYPKDLFQFQSKEDILAAEVFEGEDELLGARRRYRIYRQLLLSPAMYRGSAEDADFLYLRNYRSRLQDDLEKHTGLQLELYRNTALLIAPEPKSALTLFPNQKGISDIALQFSSVLRQQVKEGHPKADSLGRIALTSLEFEQIVKLCKEGYGFGWSKQYREGLIKHTAEELLDFLLDWTFAKRSDEGNLILLQPALGRLAGDYPQEFRTKHQTKADNGEGDDKNKAEHNKED
ncbi:TIGR02678 family protein [Desulfosporosinus sp. FKA]|uniref:TIGR02678 family protein n=1 Tax=Desulfosporosinus sp. FKA TaxID=1969834 RepID=UPI001FA911C5|nr:TIGR02678 family protein [Desulfosporosinus sp. FKA]